MTIIKIENNYKDIINYLWAKEYIWNGGQNMFDFVPVGEVNFIQCSDDKRVCCSIENEFYYISLEQFKKENPITLEDLKPGMIVTYRSETERLVVNIMGKLVLLSTCEHQLLKEYREDLTMPDIPSLDIVKVYLPKELGGLASLFSHKTLIWERPKEVELTMDEIAEKFGIPVEQLKIKK